MTIVNCPKCEEQVAIPSDASPQAVVRCPLCTEQFELGEVLERLPPALVVVEDPGVASGMRSDPAFAAAGAAAAGAAAGGPEFGSGSAATAVAEADEGEFKLAEERPAANRPAFQFEGGSTAAGPSTSARRSARPQRKQKSAVAEVVKIVGGGVLGLTIGQLILWWLPGEWGRDPFDLGPVVSRKVPWIGPKIVPAKFHDQSVAQASSSSESATQSFGFGNGPTPAAGGGQTPGELPSFEFSESAFGDAGNPAPANGQAKRGENKAKRNRSSDNGSQTAGGGSTAPASGQDASELPGLADPFGAAPSGDPNAAMPDESASMPAPGDDALEIPQIDLSAFGGPGGASPGPGTAPEEPPATDDGLAIAPPSLDDFPPAAAEEPMVEPRGEAPQTGLRNAPDIDAEELASRLGAAVSANIAMDASSTAPQQEQRTALREFYSKFAELGEAVAFADAGDDASLGQVGEVGNLLREVSADEKKRDLVARIAPIWIASTSRTHNGVILYGDVESIGREGPYHATRLKLSNGNTITVLSTSDPSKHYRPKAKLLVIGAIVENPEQHLGAYVGQEDMVVLDGFHTTAGE